MKKRLSFCIASIAVFILSGSTAMADSITRPYPDFQAGQPAVADQVDANFDIVYEQVNKIGSLINTDGPNNSIGIGLGAANPTSTLHIYASRWDITNNEGDFKIGNDNCRLKIGVATGGGGAGDVRIRSVGGTNRIMLGGGINNVLTVREDSVGIGTISPATPLDIFDNAGCSAGTPDANTVTRFVKNDTTTSWANIAIVGGVDGRSQVLFGDNDHNYMGQIKYSHSNDTMFFYTSNAERLTIDSAGNVGIGQTDPYEPLVVGQNLGTFPGPRIIISDSTYDSGFGVGESQNDRGWLNWVNSDNYLSIGTVDGGSNHGTQICVRYGNVGIGYTGTGLNGPYKLYVAGNAYSTQNWMGSDERWKKNIEPIDLRVRNFS